MPVVPRPLTRGSSEEQPDPRLADLRMVSDMLARGSGEIDKRIVDAVRRWRCSYADLRVLFPSVEWARLLSLV